MTTSEELRECPHCGGEVRIEFLRGFDSGEFIVCDTCGGVCWLRATERDIAIWNKRVTEASLRAELAQARARVAELEAVVAELNEFIESVSDYIDWNNVVGHKEAP